MFSMTTARKDRKKRLINMALNGGGTSVDGWKYAKVAINFHHKNFIFLDTDDAVTRVKNNKLEALCTRSMKVAILDLEHLKYFHIIEYPHR
jgi:hypothetical protein